MISLHILCSCQSYIETFSFIKDMRILLLDIWRLCGSLWIFEIYENIKWQLTSLRQSIMKYMHIQIRQIRITKHSYSKILLERTDKDKLCKIFKWLGWKYFHQICKGSYMKSIWTSNFMWCLVSIEIKHNNYTNFIFSS